MDIVAAFTELYGRKYTAHMDEIRREEVAAMAGPVGNQSKLETLRAERERVLAELQRLERFPETDPFEGQVAVIYARLKRSGTTPITYAFLRIESGGYPRWYSTGGRDTIQQASWTKLVEWLAQFDIIEWNVLMPVSEEPIENDSDIAIAEAAISELS